MSKANSFFAILLGVFGFIWSATGRAQVPKENEEELYRTMPREFTQTHPISFEKALKVILKEKIGTIIEGSLVGSSYDSSFYSFLILGQSHVALIKVDGHSGKMVSLTWLKNFRFVQRSHKIFSRAGTLRAGPDMEINEVVDQVKLNFLEALREVENHFSGSVIAGSLEKL